MHMQKNEYTAEYTVSERIRAEVAYLEVSCPRTECINLVVINQRLISHCTAAPHQHLALMKLTRLLLLLQLYRSPSRRNLA